MNVVTRRLPIDVQVHDDIVIERQELTYQGKTFEFLKFQGVGNSTYGILYFDNEPTKFRPKAIRQAVKAVKKYCK